MITLRDYGFMTKRNSDLDQWIAFSSRLDRSLYTVIWVRDTERELAFQDTEIAGWPVFSAVCFNIELRMALYERAYLNLMINNGPYGLCAFNERCRYVMFKILTPDVPQTTEASMHRHGFDIGETPAFSTRFQEWVWEDDKLDVIEEHFERMVARIEAEHSDQPSA